MSKVHHIKSYDAYIAFKKKYPRCVIFYGADWCDACKEVKDLYARIAKRYETKIILAYVDIDNPKLNFQRIPVFVFYRRGEEVNSIEGADKEGLKRLIREAILSR